MLVSGATDPKAIQAAVPRSNAGPAVGGKGDVPLKQPLRNTFNDITADNTVMIGRTNAKLNPAQKLIKFYSAPITKFSLNFVSDFCVVW